MARVLDFDALDRRPLVSRPCIGSLSSMGRILFPNAVQRSLLNRTVQKIHVMYALFSQIT